MKEKLKSAMKEAMLSKDKVRLETVRGLMSAVQYEVLQKRVDDLNDSGYAEVLQREIKKRREALEFAEKGDRPDMVTRNKTEIAVIQEFLPKQLSGAEIEKIVADIKQKNPQANMGLVMKTLKEKHSGQYDAKLASEIAKKIAG